MCLRSRLRLQAATFRRVRQSQELVLKAPLVRYGLVEVEELVVAREEPVDRRKRVVQPLHLPEPRIIKLLFLATVNPQFVG